MNQLKNTLIEKAKIEYAAIFPCSEKNSFNDCFTLEENSLFFWFNTSDHSTHVLCASIN